MAQQILFNSIVYTIPDPGDEDWGANVTSYLVAIPSGVLQRSGGSFTLTNEVDFGGTFGLRSVYYKSRASNVAQSGVVRLGNTQAVSWRDAANAGDLPLSVDATDTLLFDGVPVITGSGGVIPPPQGGTGFSSYTAGDMLYATGVTTLAKLAIGASDEVLSVNAGAPDWRKIVDAMIDAAAAIDRAKIAAGTVAHVVINDPATGLLSSEAALSVTRGGLALSSVAIGELPYGSGANTYGKLAAGTSGQFLQSGGAGAPSWRTGYVLGSFQIFTATGANTWTRPSGCRAVLVEVQGAGGGSGGCAATGVGEFAEAGGGGGGGYSRKWVTSPGSSETATVGAGGTAASAGANTGGTGGTSSFGAHCSATGGGGGVGCANSAGTARGAGGAGGVGSGGDFNYTGSDGGQGIVAAATRIETGYGGSSYFAGARQQAFAATKNTGNAGYAYGGGASGSSQSASQTATGGSVGGNGIIIVWEFY